MSRHHTHFSRGFKTREGAVDYVKKRALCLYEAMVQHDKVLISESYVLGPNGLESKTISESSRMYWEKERHKVDAFISSPLGSFGIGITTLEISELNVE
jgi:hypothetical protein